MGGHPTGSEALWMLGGASCCGAHTWGSLICPEDGIRGFLKQPFSLHSGMKGAEALDRPPNHLGQWSFHFNVWVNHPDSLFEH